MGWYHGYESRAELHSALDKSIGWELLGTSSSFTQYNQLIKLADGTVTIIINLVRQSRGDFGYKSMTIDCRPYYYDVPVWMVEQVTCQDEGTKKWIKTWRASRDVANFKKRLVKTLVIGQRYVLNGKPVMMVGWTGKPLTSQPIVRSQDNALYRYALSRIYTIASEVRYAS